MIKGNAATERTQMETQISLTQKAIIFNYYCNYLQYILKVVLERRCGWGRRLVLYFESTFSLTEIKNHDIFMYELYLSLPSIMCILSPSFKTAH